jgi:alkanesulfonate monooxygenase SsuD/methylene tetrahydromethanopterin reductase-like flavin-dependent oxidoreductase (luciferase family)
MKLGLTLPSFRSDPEVPLRVARTADAAGVDGVFAYDHLFRRTEDGHRRPALEGMSLLGAVAAETTKVALGTLVARATLRPPATLATALDTIARIAPGRLLAAIGSGDSESRPENESFGLEFGTMSERVAALEAAVLAARDRGYPVWVGGTASVVRGVAARQADGWNRWGGSLERFAPQAAEVRAAAGRTPFDVSWGGLVVLGATERAARDKHARLGAAPDVLTGGPEQIADGLRAYGDAGAEWVIAGPIDSSDPDNASILGELVVPLLR